MELNSWKYCPQTKSVNLEEKPEEPPDKYKINTYIQKELSIQNLSSEVFYHYQTQFLIILSLKALVRKKRRLHYKENKTGTKSRAQAQHRIKAIIPSQKIALQDLFL